MPATHLSRSRTRSHGQKGLKLYRVLVLYFKEAIYHELKTVSGQFCGKSSLSSLTHPQNASLSWRRGYEANFNRNFISSPVYVTRKSREICVCTFEFSCLLTFKAFRATSTTFTVFSEKFFPRILHKTNYLYWSR